MVRVVVMALQESKDRKDNQDHRVHWDVRESSVYLDKMAPPGQKDLAVILVLVVTKDFRGLRVCLVLPDRGALQVCPANNLSTLLD